MEMVYVMNEEEMIKKYIRLVRYYALKKLGKNIDIDDLIQEGCIGLILASTKFDESKACNFSTYATPWIKSKILKTIYNESTAIRLSIPYWTLYFKILNEENELRIKFNREPSILEIANSLGIKVSKVQKILNYHEQFSITSLDSAYIESKYYNRLINQYLSENEDLDEDDISLDIFVKDNHGTPEDIFNEKFDKEYLSLKIKKLFIDCNLTEREIEVLMIRFGFNGKSRTLEEIGQLFGVSRERIRQIKEKAYKKIKDSGLISSVDTFLDSYDDVYYNLEEKSKKLKK